MDRKNCFVFRMRQMMIHKIIPKKVSDQLAVELTEIFPARLTVDTEAQLVGLEIASNWMGEAAKYFVAVAAMISGDFALAENLLLDIRNSRFLARIRGEKGVARIRSRASERLCDIYKTQADRSHTQWRKTRDEDLMDKLNYYLEKYRKIREKTYDWRLKKAIWYFVSQGDVNNAYQEIMKCRGNADGTWRYSLAFLEAYRGNLDQAVSAYNKAFTRPAPDGILFEVEEFICWALERNPEKYQLNFCLGYLNYKLKNDFDSAKADFERFIENEKAQKEFPDQVQLAKTYLKEI